MEKLRAVPSRSGAVLTGCGLAAGLVLCWCLMPSQSPRFRNPSVVDVLIDSRLMVGLARLAALAVTGYVVLSIAARVHRGQWLSAVGPFKVDESVQDVDTRMKQGLAELEAARGTIDLQVAMIGQLLELLGVAGNTVDHERGAGQRD